MAHLPAPASRLGELVAAAEHLDGEPEHGHLDDTVGAVRVELPADVVNRVEQPRRRLVDLFLGRHDVPLSLRCRCQARPDRDLASGMVDDELAGLEPGRTLEPRSAGRAALAASTGRAGVALVPLVALRAGRAGRAPVALRPNIALVAFGALRARRAHGAAPSRR